MIQRVYRGEFTKEGWYLLHPRRITVPQGYAPGSLNPWSTEPRIGLLRRSGISAMRKTLLRGARTSGRALPRTRAPRKPLRPCISISVRRLGDTSWQSYSASCLSTFHSSLWTGAASWTISMSPPAIRRYPNGHPEGAPFEHYGTRQSKEAIEDAREILEFVGAEMARPPDR